jgi:dolichol-phosphate mannosyltransferase
VERVYIVVPVFNEEPNIATLFAGFRELEAELSSRFKVQYVLVDDGSSDATVAVARREAGSLALTVLEHGHNRGPGAAFATGFSYLGERMDDADWVITMEGDNTSRHSLIRQMFTRSGEGYDVVLASPYMYGGGFTQTSFLRKFLSSGANLVVKDLLDIQGILTVSSFFRLYRAPALLRMQRIFGPGIVERVGFESMVEMVMKMVMLRLAISEVAMQLDSSLRKGKSKMKIVRTIFGYLALWRCKAAWVKRLPPENSV